MANVNTANSFNLKSVAFQKESRSEGKALSIPKISEDAYNTYKNNAQASILNNQLVSAQTASKKKGQLNELINPKSLLKYNMNIQYKSSQGFFLNENLFNNQYHNSFGEYSKFQSQSNLRQLNDSTINLKSNKYFSSHHSNFGNDSKVNGLNSSMMSCRDQFQNTAYGSQTLPSTSRHKWTQEQVYDTFYKKRDNNDMMLMPDKFWESNKKFVPFKKIWADHEQQISQLPKNSQKKEQTNTQDQNQKKFQSQTNLNQENEVQEVIQMHNSIVVKKRKQNTKIFTQDILPERFQQNYKQVIQQNNMKGDSIIGNESSYLESNSLLKSNLYRADNIKLKNSQSQKNLHGPGGFFGEDIHQNSNRKQKNNGVFGSLSALDNQNNYSKKMINKYGFLPQMANTKINLNQNNSMIDLSQKDEIDLQLNQNRYSQNVYDTKILEIESKVYNDTFEMLQQTKQHIDKIMKKTRTYNRHNVMESLDTQTVKNPVEIGKRSSVFNLTERELAISRPSINCCWVENDQDIWKPQPRMGSTISIAGLENKKEMILIGGISSEIIKEILVVNPETYQYDTLKHLQEQRKQEYDEYKEQKQKRKQNKERRSSKLKKRGSLTFNNVINANNTGSNTPNSRRHREQSSEKQQQQDYEDLFNKYLYGKDNFSQRCNHTSVEIQKKTKLLIFGGEVLNQESSHQSSQARQKLRPHHRNCLNDLISFDIQTYEWRAHIGRGEIIEARRNHTANMVGSKHMIVIGGLNSEGRALDDLYVLDTITFRWINILVVHNKYVHPFPQGIAYHAACYVSEDENSSSINILGNGYFMNNKQDKKSSQNPNQPQYIKEEGLYLFGGIDSTYNYIKNKMFVLKQNGNPPVWMELNTIGKSPEKRCMNSLNFMYNMSIVILYGGKFESQNFTKYYDDLHVLNLKNLEWIQVNLEGNRKPPRAMHTTCVNHKQLIVFGGLNDKGFLKGNIEIIEFDQMIVMKMKRQQNYKLSLHQELTQKQTIKIDDPLLVELMEKNEQKDNKPNTEQQNTVNFQKMKDRVFLIDPEQEREIKKHLNDLNNAPQSDEVEEKWKPPQKSQSSNGIQQNRFSAHNPLPIPTKTYLPIPLSILKKKEM